MVAILCDYTFIHEEGLSASDVITSHAWLDAPDLTLWGLIHQVR